MPTLYPLTAATALSNLRTDLADLASVRWADASLNRAIDRAIERLSQVYPLLASTQVHSIQGVNRYPTPTSSWSIDTIEYPLDLQFPRRYLNFLEYRTPLMADPATPPSVALTTGGALSAGVYSYAYTLATPGTHETLPSPLATLTAAAGAAASITIPSPPPEGITTIRLYRTAVGGAQLLLLATLTGSPTTIPLTYTDLSPDSSLGAAAPTTNDTAGYDAYYLQLPPEASPDGIRPLLVTYATKHTLDTSGTTLPERYWDTLALGSEVHALENYLTNVLDNFEFADGMLRDKIDDTKSMLAWQAQYTQLSSQFTTRLTQLRADFNAHNSQLTHWGDIPLRYERL
jgi:hypothetical protein